MTRLDCVINVGTLESEWHWEANSEKIVAHSGAGNNKCKDPRYKVGWHVYKNSKKASMAEA